ncbi:MAG: hypothetical protein JOY69_06695 [Candidatus Eremiobacteraeota bacterium]|nr:hypothetical protein [Candidatus Eremiobacteraeota bacterium]
MEPTSKPDDVFVVRIWGETSVAGEVVRGRVEHIGSGNDRYLANFGDLCDFILTIRTNPLR